jgi:predicted dehydrogenase
VCAPWNVCILGFGYAGATFHAPPIATVPGLCLAAIAGSDAAKRDSDSVACLAGALLGAALGTAAIPTQWLDMLPQRDEIAGLADRLLGLAP